ncbi:LIM/homeobox protein Awh-like isoform X2 [Leptotrombidium deliense]|uniref:LIM/homeobox protein Awh-like isoform X2 n=1 Tax=Leptotrombidium deliense TaxID=299467 RepID=A0A443SHP9_9ACAR|nr:LIM/homeobox protein Awh-like isoform X2 [Leptotrombidium deliense]
MCAESVLLQELGEQKCAECDETLSQERSCFLRNGKILCKDDYLKLIKQAVKCSKCFRQISPSDWVNTDFACFTQFQMHVKSKCKHDNWINVRRAGSYVYHLACFACDLCQRQLSTGEQFTIDNQSNETKLLCKLHFGINKEGDTLDTSSNDSSSSATVKPNKTKRVRTTFTEEQLQVLQANFQIDSNPDGQDLERIAALTGLSKRVTQVWFQNSRARQKKYLNKARNASSGSWTSNSDVASPNSWPLTNTNDASNNSTL